MAMTNAWDETKPADSDLANTLGSQGRQLRLDIRERANLQHVWGQNVTDDGGHRYLDIASAYHPANTPSLKSRGFSLTGANAQSVVDLDGTWNTSGTPTAFKLNVTDTASNASSLLMDLQVGGASKFKVDKAGNVTIAGSLTSAGGGGSAIYQIKYARTQTETIASATVNVWTAIANVTVTITPSSSSNKVLVSFTLATLCNNPFNNGDCTVDVRLKRNGSVIATFNRWTGNESPVTSGSEIQYYQGQGFYLDSPASTSALTYTLEIAKSFDTSGNASVKVNSGGFGESAMTAMECTAS